MSVKFIHAADLHINSPMKNLNSKNEKIAKLIVESTKLAFANLVDYAIAERVAFIVVAGDVFDGSWDNIEIETWAIEQFNRLAKESIRVYIVYGNHDKKSPLTGHVKFPEGTRIFGSERPEAESLDVEDIERRTIERFTIAGQSYAQEKCKNNLAAQYPRAESGRFNIGVLHTGLDGDFSESDYAPTGVDTLNDKLYQYWALGHAHHREVLQKTPSWIAYSGVLQARHVNEAAACGFYVAEVEGGALVGEPKFVSCDVGRWRRVEFDMEPYETIDEFKPVFSKTMRELVEQETSPSDDRVSAVQFVAARVVLTGKTKLYDELVKFESNKENYNYCFRQKYLDRWILDLSEKLSIENVVMDVRPIVREEAGASKAFAELSEELERRVEYYGRLEDADERVGKDDPFRSFTSLSDLRKALKDCLEDLDGEFGDDGIDFTDPAQLKRWNEQALDVLFEEIYNKNS